MKKALTIAAVALLGVAALGTLSPGGAVADDKVTICHVAGRADDPANYITLTIGWNAVYGPGGHFNENGTTQAGHEEDTFGECEPPPPLPVTVEVVEPTMAKPDCDAPGEVIVPEKTGLRYSTQPLADGSVKVTVEADEGYVLAADSDTSWTFPAADLAQLAVDDPLCVEPPPPVVTPPVVTPPAAVVPPADVASAGPVPPVVTPPPAASVAAVTPAAATPTALPATGGMAWPIFLIGLASLVTGIGAVRLARRPV